MLSAEKAIFLQCCGSSEVTILKSNGGIREDYMEEIAGEQIYVGGIWAGMERRAHLREEHKAKA